MTSPAPSSGADRARRVQQLFDSALDIDESGRAEFLARACGGDLELRAEIEGLIASLGRANTHDILPPLVANAAPPPGDGPDGPDASLVGLRIHNYQVDAAIGSGGMAQVYVAHHLVFPRKAALKVLQERFSRNTEIVQRFVNEARAANAIAHPNIIEVIDAGRLEASGAPYILMEYLDGESLGARLRAGRLPIREAVRIAIETAEAVAAAHDKGIVHRDLKPENIFLVRRAGAPPLIKVLDFGIAKLRSDVANTLAQTQVGMIMGTPQYMSPEHCRDASTVDQRTDIYSLGVILYEMVCGKPPFHTAGGFADIIYHHVGVAPEPPRKFAADLPIAIESIILRCLAKSPDDRYPTMRALVEALRAVMLDAKDISASITAPARRGPAALPRSRRRVIAAVAFSLAALGGTGLALRWRHAARPSTAAAPTVAHVDDQRQPPPTAPASPAPVVVIPAKADEPVGANVAATSRPKRHERRRDVPEVSRKAPSDVTGKGIPESLGTNPY